MKVFYKANGIWSEKVNFVDKNNVLLGYDLSQQWCEQCGWYLADEPIVNISDCYERGPDVPEHIPDLENYNFDTKFFTELKKEDDGVEERKIAVFRITDGENEKFIHLYNLHNGYYSHGFDFAQEETESVFRHGYL